MIVLSVFHQYKKDKMAVFIEFTLTVRRLVEVPFREALLPKKGYFAKSPDLRSPQIDKSHLRI